MVVQPLVRVRAERAVVDRTIAVSLHETGVLSECGNRECSRQRYHCYCALHRNLLDVLRHVNASPRAKRAARLQGVHIRSGLDPKHPVAYINRGRIRLRGRLREDKHHRSGCRQRLVGRIRRGDCKRLARRRKRNRGHCSGNTADLGRAPGPIQIGFADRSTVRTAVGKGQRTRSSGRAAEKTADRRLQGNQADDQCRDGPENNLDKPHHAFECSIDGIWPGRYEAVTKK